MKHTIKILIASFIILGLFTACDDDYIDPISDVPQGTDVSAPTITITNPSGNITIPFTDTTTDFKFQFKVTDDIEVDEVEIYLDGIKLTSYSDFLDYRSFSGEYIYKSLGLGDHTFKVNAKDLSGKTSTKSITFNIDNKYVPKYAGEKLYMPFFTGNIFTDLISGVNPTIVGTPTTVPNGYIGAAYQGATASYLSVPLTGLYSSAGISFTFWYKVNASPDRSGIITINDNGNDADENKNGGLRLLREGSSSSQVIKMNVGTGSSDSWNDGGSIVAPGSWVHIGVTVSPTESKIYFDGVLKRTSTYTSPFDFSQSTEIVIGSGMPSFTYWGHKSDLSLIDELRIYNKALSIDEVKATMN